MRNDYEQIMYELSIKTIKTHSIVCPISAVNISEIERNVLLDV